MAITLTDIFHVLVDGKDVGHVIDAVRSVPPRADPVEMKAAFDMWFINHANLCRDAITDAKAELPALRDQQQKEKAKLVADQEATLAAMKADHAAHCAKLEADIATLGTKPEAVAMRAAAERKAKLEMLAKLQADLRIETHAELEPVDAKP